MQPRNCRCPRLIIIACKDGVAQSQLQLARAPPIFFAAIKFQFLLKVAL